MNLLWSLVLSHNVFGFILACFTSPAGCDLVNKLGVNISVIDGDNQVGVES